jgi:hypothetical protein
VTGGAAGGCSCIIVVGTGHLGSGGTLGGVTLVGVGTIGGDTICLKMSASLLTATVVSFETLWKGAVGDGWWSILVRLMAAIKI